ncbi:MAG: heparinase II/III family protein [Victivallales bacterium]|nr:heparinase II/III family protein [Victivallales bacterium]
MKGKVAIWMIFIMALFADGVPTFAEMKVRIRKEHPRLFLTPADWGMLKSRAAMPSLQPYVTKMEEHLASLPSPPRLEIRPDIVKLEDGKMVFLQNKGNQNEILYGLRYVGGYEAAQCAVLYRITDDTKYLSLAIQYMQLVNEFCALSERSRILPEWYHYHRLGMCVAYDWLYDKLSPEQRHSLMLPLLKHIHFMEKPGFKSNGGEGISTGNYGEKGLQWFAGLAAYQDGIEDALAEHFLQESYGRFCAMMDYREENACGKGLLSSITADYSFVNYPIATCNFMHTLKTATGIDASKCWSHLKEYGNYFNWMSIPRPDPETGFYDFGWGDAFHYNNTLPTGAMYTHLAQIIHFYGENLQSRAIMELLPKQSRKLIFVEKFPWLPFILTDFNPEITLPGNPLNYLSQNIAEFFPSYGLMNVRSGFSPTDTFASVKAGARQMTHQHYDELSFVIYKNGFQALDTGCRGNDPHHKAYYPMSIAHNTLLIRMPDEPFPHYWYSANGPRVDWSKFHNDGGQFAYKAKHLGFSCSPYHAVIAADATNCYLRKKCKEASRIFVYIKPDYFVVYDRLESTQPEYQKVFLLHTQGEPSKQSNYWRSQGGNGALFLRTLLPLDAKTEIIGGPGKEFWTNGQNFPLNTPSLLREIHQSGGIQNTWLGQYRYEISPESPVPRVHFLSLLQAADSALMQMVHSTLLQDKDTDGLRFTTREGVTAELHFPKEGPLNGTLQLTQNGKLLFQGTLLSSEKATTTEAKMYGNTLKYPKEEVALEPRPDWWRVRPEEILDLCKNVRRGKAEILAMTPGGFPVYAVFYGDFSEPVPQSNWSAAGSSNTYKSYFDRDGKPQTFLFLAGIHGSEAESVCAAVNLIQLLETGKDFRGKEYPALRKLIEQYRFIILPCANMDGRAISPDHLRLATYEQFRGASQGRWKDGSLIGWRGSKEWFPLPLDRVQNPGGYPNADGFNLMHDACPGHIRTAEVQAILQLCERWRVDAVLNGHSHEYPPCLVPPTKLLYPAHQERAASWANKVNTAFYKAGWRQAPPETPIAVKGATFNLNTMMQFASGAIAVTLECNVGMKDRPCTFEDAVEPNFTALQIILEDGLQTPFTDRSTLFK